MATITVTQISGGGFSIEEVENKLRYVNEFGYDTDQVEERIFLKNREGEQISNEYLFSDWTIVDSGGVPSTGFTNNEEVVQALQSIGAGFKTTPGGSGVQSVTGDGVGGTQTDVIMTFPTIDQVVPRGATPPLNPNVGDVWDNPECFFARFVYDGNDWVSTFPEHEEWNNNGAFTGGDTPFMLKGTVGLFDVSKGVVFDDDYKVYSFTISNASTGQTGSIRIRSNGVIIPNSEEAFDLSNDVTTTFSTPIILPKKTFINVQYFGLNGTFRSNIVKLNLRKVYIP